MRGILVALCVLLLSYGCIAQNAVGLNNNNSAITNACGSGCPWETASLWTSGAPPGPNDAVTLNIGGNYKIVISGNVSIYSLNIGAKDTNKQTVEITAGSYVTVLHTFSGEFSSVVNVAAGASLIISEKADVYGSFTTAGFVSIGGTGLHIGTDGAQKNPLSIVFGKLTLVSPTIVVAPITVDVSSQSSIVGSGTINTTTLKTDGKIFPGKESAVGAITINGNFDMSNTATVTMDIANSNSFDQLIVGGTFAQDGTLVVDLLGNYVPLHLQTFIVFNHSDQSGGFNSIHGTNTILPDFLNKDWNVKIRTGYTMVQYGSASSLVLSFISLSACVLFAIL